jgi:uncharacterized repeat protein (TIGR03803 family)
MKPSSKPPRTPSRLSDSVHQLNMDSLAVRVTVGFILLTLGASVQAQTFTTLYNFTGGADGGYPYGGVVEDASDNLYGTTLSGSVGAAYGVVFKVDTTGTETVVHSFAGPPTDGAWPEDALLRDKAGNLYGTTSLGGTSSYGVVFRVDTSGKETVLHSFGGGTKDGCNPYGGLIRDSHGNLYGMTSGCGTAGYGVVFKLAKRGKETVLHSFKGGAKDGASPSYGNLLADKLGNLYGVTWGGGSSGLGVVFKIDTTRKETVLHSFAGGTTDGCYLYGTPAMDRLGNLYGTTYQCGSSNYGTVWKVGKNNRETILHNFAGYPSDGANPYSGVVRDSKGNLYGDTNQGGASHWGAVYELSKNGTLTLLHSFAGTDGGDPVGGLLLDPKGNLYGTTECTGTCFGTVWLYMP